MDVVTYAAAVGAAKKYTDEQIGSDDAVKYTEQSLTSEQQAQARENIGAAASTDIPTDAVKYTAQTLTDAQKSQARQNIGASDGDYRFLTNAPPLVKGSGTGGNLNGGTGMNSTTTTAKKNSIAYGDVASAKGDYSVAFGYFVQALHDYEIAFGKLNQSNADTAFSIGNGTSSSDRHNLMELKTDGTLLLNGNAVKTEGGDDDKLRLGQICGMKFSSNTAGYHTFSDGFGYLFDSINSITFTSDTNAGVVGSATVYQFGDFVGYIDSNAVIVRPLRGKLDYPTTGQWIKVENCYNMFSACDSIRTLDLTMFDISEVESMESMFSGCKNTNFKSLDLSTFDTSNVKSMKYMFNRCTNLKTLDISSFDMTNVTNYTNMFGSSGYEAGITTLKTPKINPHDDIPLPRTLYSQDGTAYTKLPVTTGTSIELRQSWT